MSYLLIAVVLFTVFGFGYMTGVGGREQAPSEPAPVTVADLLESRQIVTTRGEPCELGVGSGRAYVLITCEVR